LDLNAVAQEAIAGEEKLKLSNDASSQPPIIVIVKPPCIAFRYPLPIGLVSFH
jgi:hypothetical protein